MNINPFYFEYYKQTVGFSPVKDTKKFRDFDNKSTEQIKYILDYSSSNSTVQILISHFLSNAFEYSIRNHVNLDNTRNRFISLMNQWKEETAFLSSITEICTHPAYQQIIGMGEYVLPLIVNELRKSPDHWFWALKSISGEDPVYENDRGNISKMTNAWIDWAIKKGIRFETDYR